MHLRPSRAGSAKARTLPFSRLFAGLLPAVLLALLPAGSALASETPYLAGPWSVGRAGYWSTLRLFGLSSTSFYDAAGVKTNFTSNGKFRDYTFQLGSEYGLSERMTLDLGLPVRFLDARSDALAYNDFNNGFGDFRAGLRYGMNDPAATNAVAIQIDGSIPTGYNAAGSGRPPMGAGEPALTGRVLAGHTLAPKAFYAHGEFGYRMNFGDVSPQLIAGFEAGVWPTSRLLLLGNYIWVKPTDDTKPVYEYQFGLGGQAQYRLNPQLDVVAGVHSKLGGQNTAAGTSIVLGLSLKRNPMPAYRGQPAAWAPDGVFPGYPPEPKAPPTPVPAPSPVDTPGAPGAPVPPAPAPPDTTGGGL